MIAPFQMLGDLGGLGATLFLVLLNSSNAEERNRVSLINIRRGLKSGTYAPSSPWSQGELPLEIQGAEKTNSACASSITVHV